jgi:predicted Fe-Mo cluster-binding NifX family protein
MRIAFTSTGPSWDSDIDPRFGRTSFLLVYDEEKDEFEHYDNRDIEQTANGAGPKTAQKLFDFYADVLITGNGPGGNAGQVLEKAGINIFAGAGGMTVKEAYNAFKDNKLQAF